MDLESQELIQKIKEISSESTNIVEPAALEQLELMLRMHCGKLAAIVACKRLQASLDSDEINRESQKLIKSFPQKLKNYGKRPVQVRFADGTVIEITASYFARPCKEKKSKRTGFFPGLILAGIFDGCTPLLGSEVSKASAALCSLKEAQDMLATRGCKLDLKSIRNIVKRFAARARSFQEAGSLSEEGFILADCRVVISIDGGRLRIRKDKAGKKTKKGRRRYSTAWREPKLFIIYIANEAGRIEKKFCPFIDASLDGPDAIFALLRFYLLKIKIHLAGTVVFVADGALWIWERAHALLMELGLTTEKIRFVLDFYHAVEHLAKLLELKKFPKADLKLYLTKYRRILLKGKTSEFFDFIELITKGSRSDAIRRERNYFLKNRERMRYQLTASLRLPIGSGAVESAIRRVINMRLKGPGIFWHEDTANEMLMLRCYYKAGRWGMLQKMASRLANQAIA